MQNSATAAAFFVVIPADQIQAEAAFIAKYQLQAPREIPVVALEPI